MASISLANGHYYLTTQWKWQSSFSSDGYGFASLSAAKRYFSTQYQSVKNGCNRPIWKAHIVE
jgi:hypothetical protein